MGDTAAPLLLLLLPLLLWVVLRLLSADPWLPADTASHWFLLTVSQTNKREAFTTEYQVKAWTLGSA